MEHHRDTKAPKEKGGGDNIYESQDTSAIFARERPRRGVCYDGDLYPDRLGLPRRHSWPMFDTI